MEKPKERPFAFSQKTTFLLLYCCNNNPFGDNEMLRFSDGVTIDTSGELRLMNLSDGSYVVGQGMLIPVNTREEGQQIIEEMKKDKK